MSGRRSVSGATTSHNGDKVSLRDYIDTRLDSVETQIALQKEALTAAQLASDRAIGKAESATDRRLEGMNEFRTALNDYSKNLMPRAECEKIFADAKERLDRLNEQMTSRNLMPRLESEKMHGDARERIDSLTQRFVALEARGQGRSDIWGWIAGAIGVLIAVITIMNKVFGGG